MTLLSPKQVYENLTQLDSGNSEKSADYRQQAQEILANPNVSLRWRLAIADRLGQANNLLAMTNITGDDSY